MIYCNSILLNTLLTFLVLQCCLGINVRKFIDDIFHKKKKGLINLGTCAKFIPPNKRERQQVDEYVNSIDFQHVDTFVMFLSDRRTGHSWIGSILDSSPNAMIANEFDAFQNFEDLKENLVNEDLFRKLARNSHICGRYGRIQIYNYTIPGLWQGKVATDTVLKVIGDKKGASSTRSLMSKGGSPWKNETHALAQKEFFARFLKMTGTKYHKIIIVLRNPFNMIATQFLRAKSLHNELLLLQVTRNVLFQMRQNLWAKDNLNDEVDWFVLPSEEFARDTQQKLQELCNFTTVDCPSIMMTRAIEQTHHISHDTWQLVDWSNEAASLVNNFIREHLSEYYSPLVINSVDTAEG